MKLISALLLLAGLSAQAQVPETITYFIGSQNIFSSPENGVYYQLNPDGTFITLEVLGYEPMSCEGVYTLTLKTLEIEVKKCGQVIVGPDQDIMMFNGQSGKNKMTSVFAVNGFFDVFPIEMNENGFSAVVDVTTTVVDEEGNERNNKLKGPMYGARGTILQVMNQLFPQ